MTITLIGAGNVGYHLGRRLHKKGWTIRQVFSRKLANAELLATKVGAHAIDDLMALDAQSDWYIISVSDDAIGQVAQQLSKIYGMQDKLVVHTSGAASTRLIAKYFKRAGVFYPLQTFSKNRKVKFRNIPICVYVKRQSDEKILLKIAKTISKTASAVTDADRAVLHVAAVFVNNFSNHLFHIGQTITEKEAVTFDLLKPLIQETVLKIEDQTPLAMQTGPARRNDTQTLKKHEAYLQKFPDFAQLYNLLTKSIQDAYRR
ncbi:MAG: DUF2520 domain-containing protein [Bacteroidota bacterium]